MGYCKELHKTELCVGALLLVEVDMFPDMYEAVGQCFPEVPGVNL